MDSAASSSLADARKPIGFFRALMDPVAVKRALQVGAVVGTILVAINHGDAILKGEMPSILKMMLTYCVPYCVSSYSTAMFMVELSRKSASIASGAA